MDWYKSRCFQGVKSATAATKMNLRTLCVVGLQNWCSEFQCDVLHQNKNCSESWNKMCEKWYFVQPKTFGTTKIYLERWKDSFWSFLFILLYNIFYAAIPALNCSKPFSSVNLNLTLIQLSKDGEFNLKSEVFFTIPSGFHTSSTTLFIGYICTD